MTNKEDLGVLVSEPFGLVMHLRHQWARCVNSTKTTIGGLFLNLRGHAVSREHHEGIVGHFVELINEDRSAPLQGLHDVAVVDNLLAHVHRSAIHL